MELLYRIVRNKFIKGGLLVLAAGCILVGAVKGIRKETVSQVPVQPEAAYYSGEDTSGIAESADFEENTGAPFQPLKKIMYFLKQPERFLQAVSGKLSGSGGKNQVSYSKEDIIAGRQDGDADSQYGDEDTTDLTQYIPEVSKEDVVNGAGKLGNGFWDFCLGIYDSIDTDVTPLYEQDYSKYPIYDKVPSIYEIYEWTQTHDKGNKNRSSEEETTEEK